MEELFDIEYWLPFNGGEYHCTIAVGVTQQYVDKVTEEYERSLSAWRAAPSAWSLPFHHTMKVVPHEFLLKNKSFVKTENHNQEVKKAESKGQEEGMRIMAKQALWYITNNKQKVEFKKAFKKYFND